MTDAERVHDRLLMGISPGPVRVTADELRKVAERAGTTKVPQIAAAIKEKL